MYHFQDLYKDMSLYGAWTYTTLKQNPTHPLHISKNLAQLWYLPTSAFLHSYKKFWFSQVERGQQVLQAFSHFWLALRESILISYLDWSKYSFYTYKPRTYTKGFIRIVLQNQGLITKQYYDDIEKINHFLHVLPRNVVSRR